MKSPVVQGGWVVRRASGCAIETHRVLKLIIEDDEGRKTVVPFVRDEITIGRQEGNTIRLTERNVSRRHARLIRHNGTVLVEDLGSYNGIRINGERIQGQVAVQDGDLIQIGDYDLAIQRDGVQPTPPPAPTLHDGEETTAPSSNPKNGVSHAGATQPALPVIPSPGRDNEETAPLVPATPAPDPELAKRQSTSIIRVDQVEASRPRQVQDIEPEEAPRLVVLNTELAGREFACIRTELRVGRTDDNDIAIDHRSLSRTHAKFVREDNGEWRVIDMQSANGVAVNGEPYAQASLRSGDVVELGHVKLKFVGPGEAFHFVPDEAPPKKPRGSKAPLVLVLLLLLAAGGGVGAYFYIVKPGEMAVEPPPVEPAEPDEAGEVTRKLDQAREAVESGDWDTARTLLEESRLADGSLAPGAKTLLGKMKEEQSLKDNIDRAREAYEEGNLEEAKRLLDEAAHTTLLAKLHRATRAKVDEAYQARLAKSPPQKIERNERPPKVEKPPPPKVSPRDEAQKQYDDGVLLFKNKQFREARTALEKCLKIDPAFAPCHKLLGSVYATLKDPDRGYYHYKKFLQLAPDDPSADKVRHFVEQFENVKQR